MALTDVPMDCPKCGGPMIFHNTDPRYSFIGEWRCPACHPEPQEQSGVVTEPSMVLVGERGPEMVWIAASSTDTDWAEFRQALADRLANLYQVPADVIFGEAKWPQGR